MSILFKVFVDDIQRLAAIDELWKSRAPPVPLSLSSKELADLLAAEPVDCASVDQDLKVPSVRDTVKLLMQR